MSCKNIRIVADNNAAAYASVTPMYSGSEKLRAHLTERPDTTGWFEWNALGLRKYAEFLSTVADYMDAREAEMAATNTPADVILTKLRTFNK